MADVVAPLVWGAVADRICDQRLVYVVCIASDVVMWFSLYLYAWSFDGPFVWSC